MYHKEFFKKQNYKKMRKRAEKMHHFVPFQPVLTGIDRGILSLFLHKLLTASFQDVWRGSLSNVAIRCSNY